MCRIYWISSFKIIKSSHKIIGIDNVNNYYDPRLKLDRLSELKRASKITKVQWDFFKVNLEDDAIKSIFNNFKPDIVIHLAAQAGVKVFLKILKHILILILSALIT